MLNHRVGVVLCQAGSRTFYLVCLQDITKLKEATLSNTYVVPHDSLVYVKGVFICTCGACR